MASLFFDSRPNHHHHLQNQPHKQNGVVEEIEGLIRVYRDGHVERPPIIPNAPCTTHSHLGIISRDVVMDKLATYLWARIYVPTQPAAAKLPLLVYFHGGGFCVGSPAWSCYHDFLANLASKAKCVVVSVNYRLAPEHRLPAAYDDAVSALTWVKQQAQNSAGEQAWWSSRANFSSLFLAGDSAGANVAYNAVATRLAGTSELKPMSLKGIVLIQPFFGGESRTESERNMAQPANSALSLFASDTYWRLALPVGASRDHPWCNPAADGGRKLRELKLGCCKIMVCVSEMDILKDRNLEFCAALASSGKRVETVTYRGVGHAFQVVHNSQLSGPRTQEMMVHIKAFINQ